MKQISETIKSAVSQSSGKKKPVAKHNSQVVLSTTTTKDAKVKSAQQSSSLGSKGKQDASSKRKYDTISDEDRLKLILMIKDFGMSCHKASKVLNIAYNNAKVIYRIFKNEQRIRQTPKQQKRHAKNIRADYQREREKARAARVEALMVDESDSSSSDSDSEACKSSAVDLHGLQVCVRASQSEKLPEARYRDPTSYGSSGSCGGYSSETMSPLI